MNQNGYEAGAKKFTPLLKKSLSAAFPLRRFWGEKAVAQRKNLQKKKKLILVEAVTRTRANVWPGRCCAVHPHPPPIFY
jgi:hypothetical protein